MTYFSFLVLTNIYGKEGEHNYSVFSNDCVPNPGQ